MPACTLPRDGRRDVGLGAAAPGWLTYLHHPQTVVTPPPPLHCRQSRGWDPPADVTHEGLPWLIPHPPAHLRWALPLLVGL